VGCLVARYKKVQILELKENKYFLKEVANSKKKDFK